jgi:competence protein ComEC
VTEEDAGTKPTVRAWFMNVGNGDCTVIVDDETGFALVVDCPSSHVDAVRRLLEQERATLHTCIVTHWDADHYGGVARLAVGLPVSRVIYNHDTLFESPESPPFAIRGALKEFLDIPNAAQKLGPALAGSHGNFGGVSWRILAPNYHELTAAYVAHQRNVASAVVEVRAPGLRVLIGGDAVAQTWSRLAGEMPLKADILRWPHHGAPLSGDKTGAIMTAVLESVSPSHVIISAGAVNTYGHPSADVIQRLSGRARVMCTQVTAGCFGFRSNFERRTDPARQVVADLPVTHCANTIQVRCFEDAFTIWPTVAEHESQVKQWSSPMCHSKDAEVTMVLAMDRPADGPMSQ